MGLREIEDVFGVRLPPCRKLQDLADVVEVWLLQWDAAGGQRILESRVGQTGPEAPVRRGQGVPSELSRFALQNFCAEYLDIPGADIRFDRGVFGKPALSSNLSSSGLQFNISHAGDFLCLAFGINRQVGLDIEVPCPLFDFKELASDCFSPREFLALATLTEAEQRKLFFLSWTRKEAFVKALGLGLNLPLHELEIIAGSHGSHRIQSLNPNHGLVSSHTLIDLRVETYELAGAVAVEGSLVQLELHVGRPKMPNLILLWNSKR